MRKYALRHQSIVYQCPYGGELRHLQLFESKFRLPPLVSVLLHQPKFYSLLGRPFRTLLRLA